MKAIVIGCVILLVSSCSGSSQGSKIANRYVIDEQEIMKSNASNAYELVREKRPEFLRAQGPKTLGRGISSTRFPAVYLNGLFYGELKDLASISIDAIKEIRYLNEVDAQQQFGLGNVAGAIVVITKK
jgi:hypothetical protein